MTALGRVDTAAGPYSVRRARAHDVPALVALLAADAVAAARGDGVDDLAPYERAFRWAIEWARDQGCGLVQLTTDATRHDAHHFYARLGFEPTHLGFKLPLEG